MPAIAYLALGSNLGNREGHLTAAREAIDDLPDTSIHRASALYESAAWGANEPQPHYLNAVVAVLTALTPVELWRHTTVIERGHGRTRSAEKNAARTLDIDLLLFDDIVMNTTNLVLPHPRLHLRKFVLQPLLEVAAAINIPGLGPATELLAKIPGDDARKVSHNSSWN